MTQPPMQPGPYPPGQPQHYPAPPTYPASSGHPQWQGYPRPGSVEPDGNAYTMPAAPPMAVPGAPAPQALGTLVLNVQGSVLTQSFVPPTLTINGNPVRIGYGRNVIPCPSGRHHLQVHMQWMRQYGQAAMDVNIAPGQTVEVFYAGPYNQFSTGAIGFQQQRHGGAGLLVGILVGSLALVMLIVLFGLVAASF